MEKQIDEVITDKNFKSNKIEPVSNMAIDVMNTGLPLELAGAIAIDLYEKGYRKETQGEWVEKDNPNYKTVVAKDKFGNETYLVGDYCSVCNHKSKDRGNYCPNCGTKMRGE